MVIRRARVCTLSFIPLKTPWKRHRYRTVISVLDTSSQENVFVFGWVAKSFWFEFEI